MITNKINMRIIFLFLLGVIAFIAPVQRLVAQQQYPVHIQPTVSFPSTLLNDYSDPANTNIRVYLADLSKLNYTINIRIALTSGSISYKSIHGINVTLDGGQVYFLNANELSRLFALTDLTIAPAATNNEPNSLPEGIYSLALESFDASLLPNIVIPVSNIRTDFAIFNVVRYDPPLLNSPTNKQEFDLQTTNQNIFFNWTPRSISYSPSQHIQYRYRMIRVIPVDRNPYDAVNTTLAGATGNIDVNALDFATFIYSPTDLPLIPGSVYAWQVQAYEMINGVVSTSRFKNQGFSEVFTFSIKENCAQITLAPAVITGNSVSFTWNIGDASSVYNEYEFNYRAVSSATGWIPISTTQNTITLDNTVLQTGIIYEYNVRARCNNWLLPVQGVNFILATPTCVAPTPITVNTTGTTTALSWAKATSVDSLKLYYKITGSTDPFKTLVLNPGDIQCNIPLLTSGGYTIHLDAFCGSEQTAGITNSFAYNETGIVGPCPIPLPFQLIATRIKGDTANLKWNTVNGAHTGSSITYWHKDSSTVTYNYNALTTSSGTGVTGIHVYDDQVYSYQITYLCGTKNQTTPIGMFRILSASAKVNIDPPTANCFPPVGIRAEARDSVTARVEWDKISGADNYELSYRVKGSRLPFTTFNTTATNATLKPLQKNAQYQLLVRVKCSSVFSIYSDTALVDLTVARNRNCDTATFFKALKKTTNNIQTAWNFDATCTGYIIKFREEAQPLASEYTQAFTNIDSLKHNNVLLDTVRYTFQNLKSGTRYVFRIQKICGQNNALFNLPLIATTLADAKSSGACGSGNVCNKDSTTKLKSMVVGDTIYCADYQVVVDSVTTAKSNPSMGIYSGLGHMEMPVPGLGDFVSMHVSFKNVKINGKPNSCVYGGVINIDSMNASIIPTGIRDSVKAIMAKAQGLIDEANAALAEAQGAIDKLQAGLQQGINYFQGGDGVGNVVTGKLGETDIQTDIPTSTTSAGINGNTITIGGKNITVAALPVLLRDNTDEVFQVTSTGAVTYVGKYDTAFAKNPSLDLTGKIVTYSEFSGATYDFDKREAAYSVSIQIDREYEKIGTSYYVPAKFIIPGELDKVTATFSGTVAEASKVVFSNGTGFVYDKGTQPGKTFTLNLAGGPASDGQYIYAWYVDGSTKKAIGKLLLPSYAPQVKNVVLVPVKGKQTFNAATYEAYLNATYQKIGITYHVTLDESFRANTDWATSPTDLTIQSSSSSLLSNDYQGKEKAVVEAYVAFKGAANIDPNTAYFMAVYEPSLIKDSATSISLLGKMPAQEQFGFLYTGGFSATGSAQDDGLKRTMAHELGHGAYHMEHTFNSIYLGTASRGNTANLMDYSTGNELWKFQWDIVHSPGHVWGILKRDKDAQAASQLPDLLKFINDLKTPYRQKATSFGLAGKTYNFQYSTTDVKINFQNANREYIIKRPGTIVSQYMWESTPIDLNGASIIAVTKDLDATPDRFLYSITFKYTGQSYQDNNLAIQISSVDYDNIQAILLYWNLPVPALNNITTFLNTYYDADDTHNCNYVDMYYEGIPDAVAATRSVDDLKADIRSMAQCDMDELGTDEESAIINAMDALGKKDANGLLDLLREQVVRPINNDTYYTLLYNGLDDIGGGTNFSKFTMLLYKYWTLSSKYNTNKTDVDVIPYSSSKMLSFYFDNIDIESNDQDLNLSNNLVDDDGVVIGTYDLYDPIYIVDISNSKITSNGLSMPAESLPFFYLKSFDRKNETSNTWLGTQVTVDIALTFTGVGNIAKLRHLKHLTTLNKLKVIIGTVEVTSGVANLLLKYSECNTDFCKAMGTYLFWIEVATFSMDIATEAKIIQAAKDARKAADATIDVNVIEHLDDVIDAGRDNWNGFATIFKAYPDEILDATNRIKTYRLTAALGGNYGYIEGIVNNAPVDNKLWRSGPANLATEPQIFTAIQVQGAGGKTWLRTTDSEYKMLNKLASDLGGTPGAVKPNIIGQITVVSENPYCASCAGIIQQFNKMFPNIKLILVDGAK